jgi:hypothetical protein
MSNAISALIIPQEATELTLDELKMISGGHDDDCHGHRRFKLVKKIVTIKKIFKPVKNHSSCDDDFSSCDDGNHGSCDDGDHNN